MDGTFKKFNLSENPNSRINFNETDMKERVASAFDAHQISNLSKLFNKWSGNPFFLFQINSLISQN